MGKVELGLKGKALQIRHTDKKGRAKSWNRKNHNTNLSFQKWKGRNHYLPTLDPRSGHQLGSIVKAILYLREAIYLLSLVCAPNSALGPLYYYH